LRGVKNLQWRADNLLYFSEKIKRKSFPKIKKADGSNLRSHLLTLRRKGGKFQ